MLKDLAIAGEGAQTEGTYYLGASPGGDYTNLNSDDDDTSHLYVTSTATSYYHCWDMVDFTEIGAINGVNITVKGKRGYYNGAYYIPYVRIGTTNYYETQLASLTTSYADYISHTWTVNPSTVSDAWTAATLNGVQFGVRMVLPAGLSHEIFTTFFKSTVDYIGTIGPFPVHFRL
jgi:hypothetical protein